MTLEVATKLMGFTNAKKFWEATHLFGVQSRAEEDFLRQTFQTTRKGSFKMEDYLCVMKTNVDNLSQAGSLVPPCALISQVLLGLDEVYNLVIVVIQGKLNISWLDMQSELLIFEKMLEHHNTQRNTGNIVQNVAINMAKKFSSNESRSNNGHQLHGNIRNNFSGQRGGPYNGRGRGRGRDNKPTCQAWGQSYKGNIADRNS
ncbi:uncharacterized protein LOC116403326 isoform X1 [Cucumis sativus]|uniref:uncharacterized protein LOC116403326 isoform X1 n=1 Tax=Cucumis sativus TaxID=3659 RepID=UPI0012F490E9|nr:uncharacterized protein LOC116403326 isoform X1 [Cucumis sativus]